MAPDKILDRVRKLLRLAGNAGSEAEAATAAARAADLMREHAITEASVAVDDGERVPEPILQGEYLDPEARARRTKKVAWKAVLAGACARSLGVKHYFRSGDILGLGRESACQAWRYTTAYLTGEVDRLCEEAWERQDESWNSARSWKNAFRVGCAHRVASRLDEVTSAQRSARATNVAVAEAFVAAGNDASGCMGLVRVARDEAEVEQRYKEFSKGFGRATSIGQTSSHGGYAAGRDAGDRVSLGGTASARLPSGRGRLS